MANISGEITIGRPVDIVFDFVADQTNEPRYNSRMVRAEKVSDAPIGAGTRFRSAVRSAGRTVEMLIEVTGYERPRSLASATTMRQADIGYLLSFEPVPAGTRMSWSGRVRLKGAWRLLDPLIAAFGRRQERRIWQALKEHLETTPGTGRQ
jgi:hypothetical protein